MLTTNNVHMKQYKWVVLFNANREKQQNVCCAKQQYVYDVLCALKNNHGFVIQNCYFKREEMENYSNEKGSKKNECYQYFFVCPFLCAHLICETYFSIPFFFNPLSYAKVYSPAFKIAVLYDKPSVLFKCMHGITQVCEACI